MIQPVIIPMSIQHEPDKCPNCKNPENIKQVCRNCGYEYKEDDELSRKEFLFCFLIVSIFFWVLATVTIWVADGNKSLLDMFINQFKYVSKLKMF